MALNVSSSNTKEKIIDCIVRSEPKGISVKEIAEQTKLSRPTVERQCRILEREGVIRKKNKQAPYHVTPKVYDDPVLATFTFQSEALRKLHKLPVYPYDKTNLSQEEQEVFEFVNKVGSLIFYTLVQAVSPYQRNPTLDGKPLKLREDEKDEKISRKWIDSINPARIFSEFGKLNIVKRGRVIRPVVIDGKVVDSHEEVEKLKEKIRPQVISSPWIKERMKTDKDFAANIEENIGEIVNISLPTFDLAHPQWALYEVKEPYFRDLIHSFSRVYPEAYAEYEKIKEGAIREAEQIREMKKERELKDRKKKPTDKEVN